MILWWFTTLSRPAFCGFCISKFDPVQSIERLPHLDFRQEEKRLILGENAVRTYRIS